VRKLSKLIIYFFLLNNHFSQAYSTDKQPLLVVTIMVKNEAPVMEATLKPFFEAGLQHYLVLDTGSTDKTVQVVRDLFRKYKISDGYIVEQPFVNFAVSRNFALECAEEFFPQALFFLMIDAEWYIHNVQGLIQFCEEYQHHPSIAFFLQRSFPGTEFNLKDYVNWLFKAHKGVRFSGAVHECINQTASIKVPDNVSISVDPSRTGKQKSSERWHRDLNILLKEYEENPNNIRTMFLLGQVYGCLKNYKQALFWYGKRCREKGHDEEDYQAHYRMACIYIMLNNWDQALVYCFKAYRIRPQRIESLVHIVYYYFSIHNYYAAFLLSKYIATIRISSQEILLSVPELYEFTRYTLLAKAAWYVGEYEIGREATLKALDYDPSNVDLCNKLELFAQVLKHRDCNFLHRNVWCQWCNGNFWLNRPEWFNFCCLAHGCYRSNRLNLSQGVTWRYWVGPFYTNFSA
jgi:glycosyltransferase involved in cell wall biosynthesis